MGAKRGRRGQKPAAAGAAATYIRNVVAKPGDKQRPRIEGTDNDGVVTADSRRLIHAIGDIISAGVDGVADVDDRARSYDLTSRQRLTLHGINTLTLSHRACLKSICDVPAVWVWLIEQSSGVLNAGLQHLVREKHDSSLDDREQQCKDTGATRANSTAAEPRRLRRNRRNAFLTEAVEAVGDGIEESPVGSDYLPAIST